VVVDSGCRIVLRSVEWHRNPSHASDAVPPNRHDNVRNEEFVMESHPPRPFELRFAVPTDAPRIMELAMTLSEFFPGDFIKVIDKDLGRNPGLVGLLGSDVVGFIIWMYRDAQTAEILWMGVKEEYHGLHLGTMMLESLEQELKKKNVARLLASTLSYTVDYKPYEKVRAFYYNRGFKSLGIQQDYYQEGLDRLILLKTLR
jgi:ribosomal protein S18 acetylase RimI-like enzyme